MSFNVKSSFNEYLNYLILSCLFLFLASRKTESQMYDLQDTGIDFASIFSANLPVPLQIMTNSAVVVAIFLLVLHSILCLKNKKMSLLILVYGLFSMVYNLRVFDSLSYVQSIGGLVVGASICFLSYVPDDEKFDEWQIKNSIAIFVFFMIYLVINVYLFSFGLGYHGFRFSGLSFHPNQFGQVLAIISVALLYISQSKLIKFNLKCVICFLGVLAFVLLIASGSRGALLCFLMGAFLVMYVRKVSINIVVVTLFLSLIVYFIIVYFSDSNGDLLSRFTDTGNNRGEAFELMWNAFLENPAWGSGLDAGASENALLKSLGATGFIGGVFFISFYIASFIYSWKVINIEISDLSSELNVINAILILVVLASSFLDGYMVEKLSFSGILVVVLISSINNNYIINGSKNYY